MAVELAETPLDQSREETVCLAYRESISVTEAIERRATHLDNKTMTVFGIASLAVSVAPVLVGEPDLGGLWKGAESSFSQWAIFLVAVGIWMMVLGAWMGTAAFTFLAFRARAWISGPDPNVLQHPDWARKTSKAYYYWRLRSLGELFDENLKQCNRKAFFLNAAISCAGAEAFFIALALLLARVL